MHRYGPQLGLNTKDADFTIPNSWLREGNLEVVEITNPTMSSATLDELYNCDMVLFTTDDLTLLAHKRYPHDLKLCPTLKLLRYFAHKPATRVIVNHLTSHVFDNADYLSGLKIAIGTEAFTSLEKQTRRSSTPADRSNASVLVHTSFEKASQASDALRKALSHPIKNEEGAVYGESAAAWSDFTSLYTASGMSIVKSSMEQMPVSRIFESNTGSHTGNGNALALQTVSYLIRQSLDQALYGISAEIDEVRQAQGAARVLKEEVEAVKLKTFYEVFSLAEQDGDSKVHVRAGDRSKSREAVTRDSNRFVETAFADRLPWWRILWKVDDVRAETEAAIDRSFARNTERQLTFETGKLLNVAEKLQKRTTSVFEVLDPSSPRSYRPLDSLERDHGTFRSAFFSPILLNELRKHSVEKVEKVLRRDLLTLPIEKRRRQLLAFGGPVDVLCLRAQRSVLFTLGIIGTTGLATIVGAIGGGPLGASLPIFLSPLAMQASTAAATFAFASLFSVWLLQSRWTRAKKRFWRDWERIADGLDYDLRSNLDHVFEDVVGAQSLKGAAGLETLATKRVSELEQLYVSIEAITSQIKMVTNVKPSLPKP
ncbi:hypothetical protein CBS101457_001290 [Exobasidium rhododendri]|nr:hypothetical protein CBS101457_001290 [Exobasidium rhododendri]